MSSKWYKTDENDTIWWKEIPDTIGEMTFSFDKETEYNLFLDFEKLTPDQKGILKDEYPELYNLVADEDEGLPEDTGEAQDGSHIK